MLDWQGVPHEQSDDKYIQGKVNSAPRLAYIPSDHHSNHSTTVDRYSETLLQTLCFSHNLKERIIEGLMGKVPM